MAKKHHRPPKSVVPAVAPIDTPQPFKNIAAAIFLILSTALVYHPSLKVPFLLDDYGKIIRNPDIKSLENIPSRLIYPYQSPPEFHRNDPSRPLTYLTLTLNYHFNQLEPYGYHVVNIVLQGLVVLLIFVLASQLFPLVGIGGIALPFLAALLFAVHPLNTNVVTYVIGRAASLATMFYLSAVILYVQARRGARWGIAGSAACFILALASNQLALTLPAVILLTDFCFFSEGDLKRVGKNWKQHAVYWGLLAIYLGLRLAYFGKLGDLEATTFVFNPADYGLTQSVVLWKYAGLTVLPIGLSFEHLYGPVEHFTDPRVLAAAALYGILWAGLRRALKFSWQNASLELFGVLWFLITLSPTSSLFPTTATMAENRVYLPSIGLCLIIPLLVRAFIRRVASERFRQFLLATVMGAYILSLAYLTLRRNVLYQDPAALWADVVRRYPDHERAHKNLAIEYFNQGRFDEAEVECKKALAIDPGDFDARNNLAVVYYNMKRYPEALQAFQEIVKEKPDFASGYSNMGLVYEQLHNTDAAMEAYQNAIRLSPTLIEPLNNLAGLYFSKGRLPEAVTLYQRALRIDPNNAQILKNYERVAHAKP